MRETEAFQSVHYEYFHGNAHWVGITVLCPAISVKESTEKLKDFLRV